jgi:hypothetical protein
MKLKVVIVDLEIPPRVKKWAIRIGIPVGVLLGGGAYAWAAGLVSWNPGQTLTNTDLNGNFTYIQGEITPTTYGTRTPSAFHAYLTNATSITSGPNTPIVFDTVEYDLGAEYNASTGAFTVAHTGIYQVHCGVSYSSVTTAAWYAQLYKNGSVYDASSWALATANLGDAAPSLDGTFRFVTGDVIKCGTFQNSGSAQNLLLGTTNQRCSFSAARLY